MPRPLLDRRGGIAKQCRRGYSLLLLSLYQNPLPISTDFPPFRTLRPQKSDKGRGECGNFAKTFLFIFTRYNRGCFSNHRQNTGLPTGGNSFEAYFHQGTLPCLRRRSGAEPRCLRRQGRQCCIQHGIFFRTRQRVRLRLPELQLQRWSGREGLLGRASALWTM